MMPKEVRMARKDKASERINWIGAGLIAAAVFAVLLFLTWNVPVAFAGAGAGLIAGMLIHKPSNKDDMRLSLTGITPEMVAEAIRDGRLQIAELRSVGQRVSNPLVQFKVKQIADVADKIIDDIRKDPGDLKAARPFLNYYLDSTVKILERYAELSAKKILDKDVQLSLKRVEGLLDSIRLAFHKQLAKLLENDMLDLDTEMSVLEKTIQLEGGEILGKGGSAEGGSRETPLPM
jgi:5-bromo-4-chloroindolyl phosphate hydrolysis protein